MRIIVTGARGFIGSILALRAAEIGHDVLALDNESRGLNRIDQKTTTHAGGSLWYEKHDCQGGLFESLARWNTATVSRGVDAVVHLAAGTGSLDRPIEELRALNVEMTKRVYEDARGLGAKVFAFPTTSLGIVDSLKDSPYVLSKEEAFEWLKTQSDPRPLPFRFFNVIGAYKGFSEFRQKEVHIIPKLVDAYATDEPFVINGDDYKETADGTPSRCYVHVLDVVKNILYQVQHVVQLGNPYAIPAKDGAYWIGPQRSVTVKQMIAVFEQYLGKVKTRVGPRRAYDTGALYCDQEQTYIADTLAGGLVPAWVGIRDETLTLLDGRRTR
jgi:UDP-glucose 4-epimerase